MDLLDPFSCQLHHIAFDRLKSQTPLPCPGTQSINITLKCHCVFFILSFTIANTVVSKKSYFSQVDGRKKDQEEKRKDSQYNEQPFEPRCKKTSPGFLTR